MKANELSRTLYLVEELRKVSKSLRRSYTNACNYQLTKGQETRQDNLEKKATELGLELGYVTYLQCDPRGCSVYLLDSKDDMNSYSSKGVAIC